jgi:hypothetical protein
VESTVVSVLLAAIFLSASLILGRATLFSTTASGEALRVAYAQASDRAQTMVKVESATSLGWKVTAQVANNGNTTISEFEDMDFIAHYLTTSTTPYTSWLPYEADLTTTTPQVIMFDSANDASVTSQSDTLTFSATVANKSYRMLVVGVMGEDAIAADCEASAVAFNGDALTRAVNTSVTSAGFTQCVSLWYLLAPDVGTFNVVITYTGIIDDRSGGAISLYGMKQDGPEATSTARTVGTSISGNITTKSDGAWVVDAVGTGNPLGAGLTPSTNQTERYETTANSSAAAGSTRYVEFADTTVTNSWTHPTGNRMALVIASFAPLPAAWTIDSITPDDFDPGVWNPGEVATIVGMLNVWQRTGTKGSLAIAATNGVGSTAEFSN